MRFSTSIALLVLAVFTVTRLGLILWTGLDAVPLSYWPGIFLKGLWFDLAVLSVVIAPVWIMEATLPDRWRGSRLFKALGISMLAGLAFALYFLVAAELTFWNEFSTRFNFIAVDYLLYTHEVIGNIYESYPIGWILAGIAVAALATALALSPLFSGPPQPASMRWRMGAIGAAILFPLALLSLANADQMDSTDNAYACELSGNGVFSFFAAARRNELDYDKFYARIGQREADLILAQMGVKRHPISQFIPPASTDQPPGSGLHTALMPNAPRHLVLITVESLSAEFLGSYGSTKGLTPNLDRLASEGLRFTRCFATGTRTVRGLEGVTLGTPPIPGQSIVRRPGTEHLSTLGELLEHQGFSTTFLYGGYGYFDNMNGFFRANDYRVIDRTDFQESSIAFENIWGVADESLFNHALGVLDAEVAKGVPTFVHIMTTSNHRPYTYPDGRIDIPSPGGREGAVKYTDWSIGMFIEKAKAKPWFEDTLFVIVADHCASVAGKSKLPVASYRIPLIFFAPKLVRPALYEAVTSQIDIPPTLLDVLRVNGDDRFFGRSVFQLPAAPPRAFVSNYQALGYFRNDKLVILTPGRNVETYRVDPASYETNPVPLDRKLADEAIAYYQSASHAFKHGGLREPEPERP